MRSSTSAPTAPKASIIRSSARMLAERHRLRRGRARNRRLRLGDRHLDRRQPRSGTAAARGSTIRFGAARPRAQRRQRDRPRRPADRQRHGEGLRRRLSRHPVRRRPPPAPRRPALPRTAGLRLMATAADLDHDQSYRVPHGFFTSGLARDRSRGRGRDPRRAPPRADADRADRLGEYRLARRCSRRRARSSPTNMPKAIPGRRYYRRLRTCRTPSRRWRSSGRRSCSAAASPTSSRIRGARRTAR